MESVYILVQSGFLTYMFQEIRALQALLADGILSFLLSSILQLTELEAFDATVVVLVPIFVIPRLAQG